MIYWVEQDMTDTCLSIEIKKMNGKHYTIS